jgi:uncharacterized membrane protein YkvA (DUF1232 family)
LGFFALDPLNFAIPLLGAVDDLVLLPLLLHVLAKVAAHATGLSSASRSRDGVGSSSGVITRSWRG